MTLFLMLVGIAIGGAVAIFIVLGVFRATTLPSGAAYEKRVLLSPAELAFYHSLVMSVGSTRVVIAKVRIANLVQVTGLIQESGLWFRKFAPLSQKHIDFVICETALMVPRVLLELDDKSHLTEKAQKRDKLVNRVIAEAEYPLLKIPVDSNGYDVKALAPLINQTIAAAILPHPGTTPPKGRNYLFPLA